MNFIIKNQKKLVIIGGAIVLLGLVYYFVIDVLLTFMQNEKTMLEAAEKYYATNSRELKEEGVSTVSLQTLYDDLWIETALYEPHTTKLCSADNSWVKVRKENEEYKYYVYLECGGLKSGTDHQGPVITLNGDEFITIKQDEAYEEQGVKSVVDNVDGKLKAEDVTISGTVDITKVGTYEVRYRIKDSLDNETVVTRTVNVSKSLSSIITETTNGTNYYQGLSDANYVLFSGNLFQIISMNDETIKLISAEPISYIDYTSKNNSFEGSSIEKWLNEYYYESLNEKSKEYIVPSKYCIDTIDMNNPTSKECTNYTTEKYNVGLVSVDEFNKSLDPNGYDTYLQNSTFSWMSNFSTDNKALFNSIFFHYDDGNNYEEAHPVQLIGIRPVITIKNDVFVINGNGTSGAPYKLQDYEYGNSGESLSNRLVGEYLEYSDYLFRIKEVNKDGTVNIVQQDVIKTNDEQVMVSYNNQDKAKVYNPNENGNIGYIIDNNTNNYISTDLLIEKEYSVKIYESDASYEGGETKKYKTMFIAPSMFELYSVQNTNVLDAEYWLRESSTEALKKYVVVYEGNTLNLPLEDDFETGIKVETTLQSNIKIVEGNGTIVDPYKIR